MGGYAHQPAKSKLSILIGKQTNSSHLKNPQPVVGNIDFTDEHLLIMENAQGLKLGQIVAGICSHILSDLARKQPSNRYKF